jgi:hypothetical protein
MKAEISKIKISRKKGISKPGKERGCSSFCSLEVCYLENECDEILAE